MARYHCAPLQGNSVPLRACLDIAEIKFEYVVAFNDVGIALLNNDSALNISGSASSPPHNIVSQPEGR
jgi:hypothetical protein